MIINKYLIFTILIFCVVCIAPIKWIDHLKKQRSVSIARLPHKNNINSLKHTVNTEEQKIPVPVKVFDFEMGTPGLNHIFISLNINALLISRAC